MKNQTVIVGAGAVGMTMAIKLAQAKCPVTLIDARLALSDEEWRQRLLKRDARVFALNQASINLLRNRRAIL